MTELPRSPELLRPDSSALLVVDLQDRLLAAIGERARIVANALRLVEGARIWSVPVVATEQYPEGLGPTVDVLRAALPDPRAKVCFSCRDADTWDAWRNNGRMRIVVCGIETHVCILQTVLDLLAAGFAVYVPVDAVGARHAVDHDTALRRMESCGAILTTTETTLFEWTAEARGERFKAVSELVKRGPVLPS